MPREKINVMLSFQTACKEESIEDPEIGDDIDRKLISVYGAVQGVGFRPFVYSLAQKLELKGSVSNTPTGVLIDIEGKHATVAAFLDSFEADKPLLSIIESVQAVTAEPQGYMDFVISESQSIGEKTALVLPDIAVCEACLHEMRDPKNRRYQYPFINCTHCGPRFSIIEQLPYDRPNTSMKHFPMCLDCQAEYEDPRNRRFHAQPTACPDCGPQLVLWNKTGIVLARRHDAMLSTAWALRTGHVVAVKGLGGFHLMVDARNENAVRRLRQSKRRDEKPFALMYPRLEAIRENCIVSSLEAGQLMSPAAPIMLLRKRPGHVRFIEHIAPGMPSLGAMLPYTPLHHLLLGELGFPVVATSGNLSEEPICIDEYEALDRLKGIADYFLVHDRPIVRHVDDSIVRVINGREMVLRRARGYAPLPINCGLESPCVLAVGGHLKNTVAVSKGPNVFISQHVGDLETPLAFDAFKNAGSALQTLYECTPTASACDLHEDYASTKYANSLELSVCAVQHHFAHILACMAEHRLQGPVLGVCWDGSGAGPDGTVWGGEFLKASYEGYSRVAHLRPFRLPGGERAVREPRRSALAILFEVFGEAAAEQTLPTIDAFTPTEIKTLLTMLKKGIRSPVTTSAGRLFDAFASLMGVRQRNAFEGQAAMVLEDLALSYETNAAYEFSIQESNAMLAIDWAPAVHAVIDDIRTGMVARQIAARLHRGLARAIVEVGQKTEINDIVLTGGCFQNAVLTEYAAGMLTAKGFNVHWHHRIPPNDGGISLGQAVYAMHRFANRTGR
jgi:hydrogenase maturation protein HypF